MDKSDGEPCVPDLPCDNGNIYINVYIYMFIYLYVHVYIYICIMYV
jgi:hypothetical protein